MPLGMSSLMILSIDLLTEIGPSLSLAYEKAEELVMRRPPRDLKKDTLVSTSLLAYSYLVAGTIELGACAAAYCGVFIANDVSLRSLIKTDFFMEGAKVFTNSAGVRMNEKMQLDLVATAQTAWFCTLVLSQVGILFVHGRCCKHVSPFVV